MRAERWLLGLALWSLAGALVSWLVGPLRALPQRVWGVLLALAALGGLAAFAAALVLSGAPAGSRLAAAGAGLTALAAGIAFAAAVLINTSGPVVVTGHPTPPTKPPARLRLVSWNVLHGYPGFVRQAERRAGLIATLRDLDPDVVILQEAWWAAGQGHFPRELAAALGMSVAYARANGSRWRIGFEEGCAVLSRYPLRAARRVVLEPRRPFWQARIALQAAIEPPAFPGFGVVGVHLERDHDRARLLQAIHLRSALPAAAPYLLAGDFNAPAGSPEVQAVRGDGLELAVSAELDHALLAPGGIWRLVHAAALPAPVIDGLALSDHPLLVIEVEPVARP